MFLPQKLGIIFTKSAKQVLQKLNNTFPLENWTAFNKKITHLRKANILELKGSKCHQTKHLMRTNNGEHVYRE